MTLRSAAIEAMARAWVEYEGDEWDDINAPGMRAIKACVERELDALLDLLTERADEWGKRAGPGGDWSVALSYQAALLAVLREGDQ